MRVLARGISTVALMSMILAMFALPAFAQQENPYAETETGEAAGPASVAPGADATFYSGGFEPGTQTVVTLSGVLSGTFTAAVNDEGVATYVVSIPCDAQSGDATITFEGASDDGSARSASTDFTVTADPAAACPAPAEDGGLAATGGEFTNGAALAVLALLVGAGFLIAGRRRSTESVDS